MTQATIHRRDYQDRIINQTTDLWLGGVIQSIMVESPTGSGKTFIGLSAVQQYKDITQTDPIVVWTAMRRHLLTQAARERHKFGVDADVRFLSMFDKQGRSTLTDEIANSPDRPVIMVVDEAQHDAANTMTDVYQAITPDFTLGLTATPFRADKAKLCFEKQIRDAGIHRLITDGWLSKFNMYMLDDWKPKTVANHYLAEPERWGKSVFYFLNQVQANECYQRLIAGGTRAHLVMSGLDNDSMIEDFQSGKVDALVNCMILTEGFDCPELQTVWVRDSSRGPTMQMAGRAFRIHPDVPRKNIVQSQQTKWPITRTAHAEEQYKWDNDQWAALTPNKMMEEIAVAAIKATVENYQPLPEYILKRMKKVRRNPWDA